MMTYNNLVEKLKRDCEHVGIKLELREVDGANTLTIGIKMRSSYGQSTVYGNGIRLNEDGTVAFFDWLGELHTKSIEERENSKSPTMYGLNTLKSAYFYLLGFYEGLVLGEKAMNPNADRLLADRLLELSPKIMELE